MSAEPMYRVGQQATPDEVVTARKLYANHPDDNIEVDDDALVSRAPDGSGYWVEAWVWVEVPEAEEDTTA